MKYFSLILGLLVTLSYSPIFTNQPIEKEKSMETTNDMNSVNHKNLKLGAFSNSISVKDLMVSKKFYENLGFEVLAGSEDVNYFIMKNENALIGIFHGMFEGNFMTFNPGWDESGKNTMEFDDVRTIQEHLLSNGVKMDTGAIESKEGPASFMITDPDGNMILVDQHR